MANTMANTIQSNTDTRVTSFSAKNLSVGYGKKKKSVVLDDISLELNKGEIICLIGPNGSGKSTVLKTILNQLPELSGTISFSGNDKNQLSASELAKNVSAVMTERIHPEMMRVFDVVAMGRYPYTGHFGVLTAKDRMVVDEALNLTDISDIRDLDFDKISDGQRQRVMLARAICQETDIIVLDEPTTFLDMKYKLALLRAIRDLAKNEDKLIIMSLHELDLVKMIADQIICVGDGRVQKIGSVDEVFTGNFIQQLYGIRDEEFDPKTGQMFL